jgi:hypothetical protein
MRRCCVLLLAATLVPEHVWMVGAAESPQRQPATAAEYVAFRVDDQRLIANVLLPELTTSQVRDGLSPRPAARYGYQHFAVPALWREQLPFVAPRLGRWVVHVSPGSAIEATAEDLVGGYVQCQEAVGVLLHADSKHSRTLAQSPARYFVASPSDTALPPPTTYSAVGPRPVPSSRDWRASLEAALDDLLARELPRVRSEAAQEMARMEVSAVGYHRTWADERRRVETSLERGEGRRQYDVQAFQLGPGAPVYFVRVEWLVGERKGFAASLWMRTEPRVEIIESDIRPASWLRMFEFQGRIARDQQGLVLNVLDRDRDGWGELLFLQAGYEGFSITERRYSANGFTPTGLAYGGGC